jgi:hypothetical protein
MEPANILEPAGFFAKAHPEKQRSLAALADLDSRDPLHVSATEVFVFCSKAKRFAANMHILRALQILQVLLSVSPGQRL